MAEMLRRGGTFIDGQHFVTPVIRSRVHSNALARSPAPPTPASWSQSPAALEASPPWSGASQDGERYFDDEDTPTPRHRRRATSSPRPRPTPRQHSRSRSPVRALTREDVEEAERARARVRSRSPRRPAEQHSADEAQFEADVAIAMQQSMDTQIDPGLNSQVHGVEPREHDQDADAEDGRQPPSPEESIAPSVRSTSSVPPSQPRARPSTGPPSLLSSNSSAENAAQNSTAQNSTATSEFDTESIASNQEGEIAIQFFANVRAPVEAGLSKKQQKERMFQDAMTNGVDLRKAVGAAFVRACKDDPEMNAKYIALKALPKSRRKQDAFRKVWAEGEYKECVREKEKMQSWKKVDVLKGKPLVFEKLIMEFGHHTSVRALRSASNYAGKCKLMGKPWVEWESMAEANTYLFVTREFTQEFTECWSEWCKFKGHADRLFNL